MSATATAVAIAAALLIHLPFAARAAAQGHGRHPPTAGLDRTVRTFVLTEVLEVQPNGPDTPLSLDALAWVGGDYRRLYLRAEGEQPTGGGDAGDLQADALYGRLISPFWALVAGARLDTRAWGGERATRGMLALGLEGLAPYWFELEPTLFLSQDGDISVELTGTFDLLVTQRLILQPRLDVNAAVQKVPEFGVGTGFNDVGLGARLRYEIRREIGPYIGVSWTRRTSGTAGLAREAGEPVSSGVLVAGVRLWR
jgi:copper resistance protein B